jgi:hypothetical protein
MLGGRFPPEQYTFAILSGLFLLAAGNALVREGCRNLVFTLSEELCSPWFPAGETGFY